MAVNFNIVSAVHGSQAMGSPQNYRVDKSGEKNDLSAGTDAKITTHKLVRRIVRIQVAFNDQDDMDDMSDVNFGTTATLTIKTEDENGVVKTGTLLNALCTGVTADAQHADFGQHIATFEGFTGDLTWTSA